MPVICWKMARPNPTTRAGRTCRRSKSVQCPAFTLLRQARLDLFDFEVDVGNASNAHENAVRDFMMTATNEPARSFRQKKHPDAEDQRWSNGQTKHPSPAFNTGKSVISQIRNDDADGDGELKERYNPAPRMRRCNFGEINWNVC